MLSVVPCICASHEPTGITGVIGPSLNNDNKIKRIVVPGVMLHIRVVSTEDYGGGDLETCY